jgi:hypothetical protein
MEKTHGPIALTLDKLILIHYNIMDLPESSIWIIILFDKAFECDDDAKFWGCVGTNTEPPCVHFVILYTVLS